MKKVVAGVVLVVMGLAFVAEAGCGTCAASKKAAGDGVKLALKLPKPLFIGTPKKLKTDNLEPARGGKPRPPLYVPKGVANLATGKDVGGSDDMPIIGEMEQITDGDKEGGDGSYVELGPGRQYIQVDLGKSAAIHAIAIWHYHSQARVYRDVIVQLADDPDFITGVTTVFNNDHDNSSGLGAGKDKEYIETYEGRPIGVKGAKARYVRMYSNGSTSSEMNHYIEVEVYGLDK